jgi:NitT/TauT family transport system substrate-binding protein
VLITCLGLAAIAGSAALGCSAEPDEIHLGYAPFESTALVWVAEDQGLFEQHRLSVGFREYDTGSAALEGLLNREVGIVVGTGEFPLVVQALQGRQPRILASIARSELIKVVARKDRGIQAVADLEGKRVGTTKGTIAEFFVGRLLELNGLSIRDVALVDLRTPESWVDAVAEGDVDAVATAEPYASTAKDRLGTNAAVWSAQSSQPLYALAIATDEQLEEHRDATRRFLESMAEAEEYAVRHPAEAQAIVRERIGLSPESMPAVWARNEFALTLDQSLIAAMEDESRWLIENGLTGATSVPDFAEYVREADLRAVRPGAVNIFRSTLQ